MKNLKLLILALLVPSFMLVSCKKDEETPKAPEYKQPSVASREAIVEIPAGLEAKTNDDLGASMATVYIGLANAISNYGSNFTIPEGAEISTKKGNSIVYHYGYYYWMTYTVLSDKYTWEYEWELPNHPRFTYIYAEEARDSKSGKWTIYDPETQEMIWNYDWALNASNTYSATLTAYGSDTTVFEVVSATDNSGSFIYKVDGVKIVEIIWYANGTGTYTYYGDMSDYSGSW